MKILNKKELLKLVKENNQDINQLIIDGVIKEIYQYKVIYKYNENLKKYTFYSDSEDIENAYKECHFTWGLKYFNALYPATVKYQLI